jgi:hypothetical protein
MTNTDTLFQQKQLLQLLLFEQICRGIVSYLNVHVKSQGCNKDPRMEIGVQPDYFKNTEGPIHTYTDILYFPSR